jgi:hypothetical protein
MGPMTTLAKRLVVSLVGGAILGGVCIVGVGGRLGFAGNGLFLFGVWYNRLLMGLLIGLAGALKPLGAGKLNAAVRGLALGTLVTLGLALATGFRDMMGFYAGIAYGPIIDLTATWLSERGDKSKVAAPTTTAA